jgi:hypothetical protein
MLYCDTPEELKKKFPGAVLALRSPEPVRAMEALSGTPGVRRTVLVGDRVHAFADGAPERAAQIRQALEGAGVVVESIEAVAPSIEDLFVSALEAQPEEAQLESRP